MQIEAQEVVDDFKKLGIIVDIEEYLSEKLGYPTKRPLSKYIDQYNWITTTKDWSSEIPRWLLDIY
jgi:hypothetical protein